MKTPSPKTLQRMAFFAAGAVFSFITFYVGLCWPEVFERAFHQPFNYAWQPTWYRISGDVLGYLPLISIGVIVLLRLIYAPAVRAVSYVVGVASFYLVLFALIIYGEANSPF